MSILHRVISVKEDGGDTFYQTEGDNNYEPDPCWIPFDNITGAVTVVHRDVNPRNATLRNYVNEAEARYEAARARYYREYTKACGFSPDVERTCYLYDAQYNRVFSLSNRLEAERKYYSCWIKSARNARFGFYPPCLIPRIYFLPSSRDNQQEIGNNNRSACQQYKEVHHVQ